METEQLKTRYMLRPGMASRVAKGEKPEDIIIYYAKSICSDFEIDDDNKSIIEDVSKWCFRFNGQNARLNPGLGLWFYGNIGTGKSLLMNIVLKFIHFGWMLSEDLYEISNRIPHPKVESSSALHMCLSFAQSGRDALLSIPTGIDEIGTEPETARYMGNAINVMQYVFEEMPKSMNNGVFYNIPHIITTNLSFRQILDRYGERAVDRIGEMFNFIEFKGKSYRRSSTIWDAINAEQK